MRWLCPKCQRAVSLADEVCPFCGSRPDEATPGVAPAKQPARGAGWADVKRGLRFGVGFLLAVMIVLFALAAILLLLGHREWLQQALDWLTHLFS